MSTITFAAGEQAQGIYEFKHPVDNTTRKLSINKRETVELTYKLAIEYLGIYKERPQWKLFFNDINPSFGVPMSSKNNLIYTGSNKFEISPVGEDILKVEETDEFETGTLYADLSFHYINVRRYLDTVNVMLNKARDFPPEDGNLIKKKVYFSYDWGVLIYKVDKDNNAEFYLAKNGEFNFVKGESKLVGELTWDVVLPNDAETHRFQIEKNKEKHIPQNVVVENGRVFNAIVPRPNKKSWDGEALSEIHYGSRK